MPLLDLKTDLKSLKYGQDRPGGGDSGQPYIKTNINTVDNGLINKLRFSNFDDGFIRGGAIGVLNSGITDTLRIGKFLVDFPKGPLFIAKQIGLQLSNPRVESSTVKTDRPTRGQGFFNNAINFVSNVAGKIENAVGPTRIYNLGINTLAQVPVNAIGGHIVRHGFLPNNDDSKYYENVVTKKNENGANRLLNLTNNLNLGPWGSNKIGYTRKEQSLLNKLKPSAAFGGGIGAAVFAGASAIFNTNIENEIDSYIGGPNSVYGIGTTIIKRYSYTEDKTKIDEAKQWSYQYAGKTRNDKGDSVEVTIGKNVDYGISNITSSALASSSFPQLPNAINPNTPVKDRYPSSTDKNNPFKYETEINYYNTLGVSKNYFGKDKAVENQTNISKDNPTAAPSQTDQNAVDFNIFNPNTTGSKYTYADVRTQIAAQQISGSKFITDRYTAFRNSNRPNEILNNTPLYGVTTIYNQDVSGSDAIDTFLIPNNTPPSSATIGKYANILKKTKKSISQTYYGGTFKTKNVTVNRDSAFPYRYNTGALLEFNRANDRNLNKDEMAVVFTPINPFSLDATPIRFLAYITQYGENYESNWTDIKYAGRNEPFYIFNSFKRTVNFGLHVPCFNSTELDRNHEKLFALGNKGLGYALAGQYNEDNLLGGIVTRLTIGNYLTNTPGVIASMKFDIVENSSWDLDKKYAHYLKVDFAFNVIGDKVPMYDEQPIKPPPPPVPAPPPDPEPPPPVPDITQQIIIPPAYDQSIGSALTGLNNPGVEPTFGSPSQREAWERARGLR